MIFLLAMIGGSIHAQKASFVPGYVITIDMDTLTGVLKKLRPDQANGRVVFRNTYGIKTTYYPKNVLSYKIGDQTYVSKNVQRNSTVIGGPVGYMQVMDTGAVNLYFYYYDVNSETSYQKYFEPISKDYFLSNPKLKEEGDYSIERYNDEGLIPNPFTGDFYLERKGQIHQRVKTSGFKKQMMAYFEDDPELVEALKKKKLKFKDVIFLVQVYNRRQR